MLDMSIQNRIKFMVHSPMEFGCVMYVIAIEDILIKISMQTGFEPDKECLGLLKRIKSGLSNYILRELHFFMGISAEKNEDRSIPYLNNDFGRWLLKFIARYQDISNVPDLLDRIDSLAEEQLIGLVVEEIYNNSDINTNICDKENYLPLLLEYIRSTNNLEIGEKHKFIECLENPKEFKYRLCFLLRQFYEQSYQAVEKEAIVILNDYSTRLQEQFKEDPQSFINAFFKEKPNSSKEIYIFFSYFLQAGFYPVIRNHRELPDCIILGIHSNKIKGTVAARKRLLKFYKLLSDETRLEMVMMLSERPYYVQELAEKLHISSPSVSHHLSIFVNIGLVETVRDEHKLYYSINKANMKEIFDTSKNLLIK